MLIISPVAAKAQRQNNVAKYFVAFTDKKDSPYSLSRKGAKAYLSDRSLERRKRQGIKLTERDLPVNPNYVVKVMEAGAEVWYSSRWMNGVVVSVHVIEREKVRQLPFVKELIPLTSGPGHTRVTAPPVELPSGEVINIKIEADEDYGQALNQIQQLGAHEMHRQGFKGKGMLVAVFDAGFENLPQLDAMRHLFVNGRILDTYNFVEDNGYVYGKGGDHGTKVLSTMAAYDPGKIIGTAPEASYLLYRTEDASSEYRIEEFNWLLAAERADSAGADVINSSLGYNNFDDKSMSYTYEQMDGNTAYVTQAADMAAAVGMLVVTSAGNEGRSKWKYITAPADADSVLTVGAVDSKGSYAEFSSKGNTPDGRTKPDVVAKGAATTVVSPGNRVTVSNGTSFSSPLMAGFATSLWQAYPKLNNMEVIDILRRSGSQAQKPDSLLGYGIPDYERAKEASGKKPKMQGWFDTLESLPKSLPIDPRSGIHTGQNTPVLQADTLVVLLNYDLTQPIERLLQAEAKAHHTE